MPVVLAGCSTCAHSALWLECHKASSFRLQGGSQGGLGSTTLPSLPALRVDAAHSRGSSGRLQQALPASPGQDFNLALRTLLARQASHELPSCVEGKSGSLASSSDAVGPLLIFTFILKPV